MVKLQKVEPPKRFAKDGTALLVMGGNLQFYGNDFWRKNNAL